MKNPNFYVFGKNVLNFLQETEKDLHFDVILFLKT